MKQYELDGVISTKLDLLAGLRVILIFGVFLALKGLRNTHDRSGDDEEHIQTYERTVLR
jgi:hypothetical protein